MFRRIREEGQLIFPVSLRASVFSVVCAMSSHAAFSAAARKAAASASIPLVDLDLAGPGRPCPIVVDEEVESGSCPMLDLAASSAPLVRDVLPPASAVSPEQEVFRRQLFRTVRPAFEVSTATGAART